MTTPTATTVDAGPRAVSRRITVHAPAAEIFALVANPHRHPELDGSGTVRDTPWRAADAGRDEGPPMRDGTNRGQ